MAVERVDRKPDTNPIDVAYRAEYGQWRARTEVLVTCLCMGRTGQGVSLYAFEISALPPVLGDEPEQRVAADGSTYRITPARHRYSESRREAIGQQADVARTELVAQVNDLRRLDGKAPLAAELWPQVADHIMRTPALLAWLVSQRLLPKPPANPVPAERKRRAGITDEQRQANAVDLAKSFG